MRERVSGATARSAVAGRSAAVESDAKCAESGAGAFSGLFMRARDSCRVVETRTHTMGQALTRGITKGLSCAHRKCCRQVCRRSSQSIMDAVQRARRSVLRSRTSSLRHGRPAPIASGGHGHTSLSKSNMTQCRRALARRPGSRRYLSGSARRARRMPPPIRGVLTLASC